MDWIYSSHLRTLAAEAGPIVLPLALFLLTRSGRAPHVPGSERWPAPLAGQLEAAELTGAPLRTIRRHWPELRRWFHETSPGRWLPREDRLPDPWQHVTAGRCPQFFQLDRGTVSNMLQLAAHGKTGHAALRLACRALPILRAAGSRGRRSVAWTNRQIAAYVSRGTIRRALELLENSGLLSILPIGRFRRLATACGLTRAPRRDSPAPPAPPERCTPRPDPAPDQRPDPNRPPSGGDQERQDRHSTARATRGARDVRCSGSDAERQIIRALQTETWPDGTLCLPELGEPGAVILASCCSDLADVRPWLESERRGLRDAQNPAAWLVALVTRGDSAPGRHSCLEPARRREAARFAMDAIADAARYVSRIAPRSGTIKQFQAIRQQIGAELACSERLFREITADPMAGDADELARQAEIRVRAMITSADELAAEATYPETVPFACDPEIDRLFARTAHDAREAALQTSIRLGHARESSNRGDVQRTLELYREARSFAAQAERQLDAARTLAELHRTSGEGLPSIRAQCLAETAAAAEAAATFAAQAELLGVAAQEDHRRDLERSRSFARKAAAAALRAFRERTTSDDGRPTA